VLKRYEKLINGNLLHIATTNGKGNPNLSVATDVQVIDENKIIIAHFEMVNTPKNIIQNKNVVLTVFDMNREGLRLEGLAEYYSNGEYYDLANRLFQSANTKLKGAIVVTVEKIDIMK